MNMNKIALAIASVAFCMSQGALAATVDQVARAAPAPDTTAPVANPAPNGGLAVDEGFDDILTLPGSGWTLQNNSDGLGTTDWFQGNDTVFSAYDGATTAYIGANFNNTDGGGDGGSGIISNWLVSPPIDFGTGAEVSFFTQTAPASIWPDRLQVRVCTTMPCTNFGAAGEGTGDFTVLLLDINPTETSGGYPEDWTQYIVDNVDGLPASGTGRVAFRYYVHSAGPAGSNSNYIGIDRVTIEAGAAGVPAGPARELPSIGISAMIGLGALLAMFGFVGLRRRRMH